MEYKYGLKTRYTLLAISLVLCLIAIGSCINKPVVKKVPPTVKPTKSVVCTKKPKVIAIIDTGFGKGMADPQIKLCKFGHKDFTDGLTTDEYHLGVEVPVDAHGHGTHLAGIIDKLAKEAGVNYCLVILKYYTVDAEGHANLERSNSAIQHAINIHADYINYSGGGQLRDLEEEKLVKEFLDQGGKFVAAAGNEGVSIDFFHFYPASYDKRIVVVGATDGLGKRIPMSDYGTGVRMEIGKNVFSTLPGGQFGYMTGTSQATATATGKLVAEEKNTCN
jgi:subtilisin family serine protease